MSRTRRLGAVTVNETNDRYCRLPLLVSLLKETAAKANETKNDRGAAAPDRMNLQDSPMSVDFIILSGVVHNVV
jgi:hypothetical protein